MDLQFVSNVCVHILASSMLFRTLQMMKCVLLEAVSKENEQMCKGIYTLGPWDTAYTYPGMPLDNIKLMEVNVLETRKRRRINICLKFGCFLLNTLTRNEAPDTCFDYHELIWNCNFEIAAKTYKT